MKVQPSPMPARRSCSVCAPGNVHFALRTKSAVGVAPLLIAAFVTPNCVRDSTSSDADTIASQPITRRASPVAIRVACNASGDAATCTWLSTAPPFCARPAMSSTVTPFFSRCAAMPIKPPIVTTPVPPTPVTRIPYGLASAGSTGCGSVAKSGSAALSPIAAWGFLTCAPSAVTKLGQKPFTHEKSLLHDDWLILRFAPSGVSSGSTDKQFDCTEQSPQPSQTASLMNARLAGSG